MIHFDLSTHIYRPLTQVFNFVVTPENDFQWQYGTLASAQISEGTIGMGTLFREVGHLLGERIETIYEVISFEPNKRYGFKSVSGPVSSHVLYTFGIAEGSTKIDLSTEINPKDLFRPSDGAVLKKFKKQYKENFAMLKIILESHRIARA